MKRIVALCILLLTFTPLGVTTVSAQPSQGFGPPTHITDRVQDPFLSRLRDERIPVSIFLVNGIKLQGQIDDFDSVVILLSNSVEQMVYINAIATIVPAR